MSQIEYADLHCDSVTVCCNSGGEMYNFCGQVSVQKLKEAGCALQCFAIFTEGENAAVDFTKFMAFYNAQITAKNGLHPVLCLNDVHFARQNNKIAALLTVENLGFLNGDLGRINELKEAGVCMASLVWNNQNSFASPNLIFEGGVPQFEKRNLCGLTEAGMAAVAELNANKIIIDVSHLSDGGVEDILNLSCAPIVASHSNAAAVCNVARNLTDAQIKKIADKGGVIGLNFCRDFVGGESAFENLFLHLKHIIDVGGEDCAAFGSDFDGIPAYEEMSDCTKMQSLLQYFTDRGITPRQIEKLALDNFLRVFKDVVG